MPIFQDNSKKRDMGDDSFWKMTPPERRPQGSELPPPPPRDTESVPVEDPGAAPARAGAAHPAAA